MQISVWRPLLWTWMYIFNCLKDISVRMFKQTFKYLVLPSRVPNKMVFPVYLYLGVATWLALDNENGNYMSHSDRNINSPCVTLHLISSAIGDRQQSYQLESWSRNSKEQSPRQLRCTHSMSKKYFVVWSHQILGSICCSSNNLAYPD